MRRVQRRDEVSGYRRGMLSPTFAVARWGAVRAAVVILSALAASVLTLVIDPAEEPRRNPALLIAAVLVALAAVISSLRMGAVPVGSSAGLARSVTTDNGRHPGTAALRVVGPLSLSDATWSAALFVVAALGRTVVRIAAGVSDAGELVFILLGAGLWVIAYGAGWSLGAIFVTAVSTAVRLAAAHRRGQAVSWSWWVVPPMLLLVVTAPLLMSAYSLMTGASYSGRGLAPLVQFLTDDGRSADGAEVIVLWLGKLAFAALAAGIAALAVDRVRHARAGRRGVDSE